MKIYRLKSGVQIERDGACYKAEVEDWDQFINDDNLYSKLLWLTEPERMKKEDLCAEGDIIAPIGNRSPTMLNAHVSPGLRAKTRPQTEQRSKNDHPEKSRPWPQCGQRLRNPRPRAVAINFDREGVMRQPGVCGCRQEYIARPSRRASQPRAIR